MPAASNLAEALRGREPCESRVAKNPEDSGRTFSNEPINFGELQLSLPLHLKNKMGSLEKVLPESSGFWLKVK